jgi:Cys-tRNA(Pro) deacylase|tara:strand:- start:108 stop:590 length:483 start_codon:yes stop_codon:yes gene_type:complete
MNNLLDKEPVKRVEKVLAQFDQSIKIQILDKTARTAEDAAESLKTEVGSIVKSLLLRTKTSFLLCLVAGDKRCSLNKVKKLLNQKDVSMANAEQVKEITGFTIGGVSPVGHINKIDIYIDESLKRFVNIFAAAGHPNAIFKIDLKNLKEITNGTIMNVSE